MDAGVGEPGSVQPQGGSLSRTATTEEPGISSRAQDERIAAAKSRPALPLDVTARPRVRAPCCDPREERWRVQGVTYIYASAFRGLKPSSRGVQDVLHGDSCRMSWSARPCKNDEDRTTLTPEGTLKARSHPPPGDDYGCQEDEIYIMPWRRPHTRTRGPLLRASLHLLEAEARPELFWRSVSCAISAVDCAGGRWSQPQEEADALRHGQGLLSNARALASVKRAKGTVARLEGCWSLERLPRPRGATAIRGMAPYVAAACGQRPTEARARDVEGEVDGVLRLRVRFGRGRDGGAAAMKRFPAVS
ncbi:hypothetical protein VTO73DRAFT_6965 [Trametes versicolor]